LYTEFWIHSPGVQFENLTLEAHQRGLGVAWLAATPIFEMQGSPARPLANQSRALMPKAQHRQIV
jgi:hypothetical protein